MAIRRVACPRSLCHRPPAPRRVPAAPLHIPVHRAPKPLLAYQMVTLPSFEVLHNNFMKRASTQAIAEDPHSSQLRLVPNILEDFAGRKMMYGMIKVELSMMLWSYKDLKLPADFVKLLIDNISDSLSQSANEEHAKNALPVWRENLRESSSFNLEQATRSLSL